MAWFCPRSRKSFLLLICSKAEILPAGFHFSFYSAGHWGAARTQSAFRMDAESVSKASARGPVILREALARGKTERWKIKALCISNHGRGDFAREYGKNYGLKTLFYKSVKSLDLLY